MGIIEIAATNGTGHIAKPGQPVVPHVMAVLVDGKRIGSVVHCTYRGVQPREWFEAHSRGVTFGADSATQQDAVDALVAGVFA